MASYYMFFAPSARVPEQETTKAVATSDLRSVAECAIAVHNAKISGLTFDDICVEQNEIESEFVCMDSRFNITQCNAGGIKRPAYSFIITKTGTLNSSDYNDMMEILEKNFATSDSFGIFQNGLIVSGGTSTKRKVPDSIQKQLNIQDGQLVYMTHYDIPDPDRVFTGNEAEEITCPAGTNKVYRFGRWQCVGYNMKTSCGGDMIWDGNVMECVPDESRKPLCAAQQTAVMVDNVWECINPFNEHQCSGGLIPRLNYETLEWECVEDPNKGASTGKCSLLSVQTKRGQGGGTLRVIPGACTDCETQVVNEETCQAFCIPDVNKLSDPRCYPGNIKECTGRSRAFYFGFPNVAYIKNVDGVSETDVPFDSAHSQNRKFNCLDCGSGSISKDKSNPPFTAVCEK